MIEGTNSDYGISFWNLGQRIINIDFSLLDVNYVGGSTNTSPDWWYAAIPNPNPTSASFATRPDGGAGRTYVAQIGIDLTPSGVGKTSQVHFIDPRTPPQSFTSSYSFSVNGQPEMIAFPTLGTVATSGGLPIGQGSTYKCDSHYLMWYEANDPIVTSSNDHQKGALRVRPFYYNNSGSTAPFVSNASFTPHVARNVNGSNIGEIGAIMPGTKAAFALTPPYPVGAGISYQTIYLALNQEIGLAGSEGIYCFRLNPYFNSGTATDFIVSFDDLYRTPQPGRASGRTTLDESRIIGSTVVASGNGPTHMHRVTVTGSTFTTSELELSRDYRRIAWAEANGTTSKVFLAALDPGSTVKLNPATSTPYPVTTIVLPAGKRVAGLEFAPDNSYTLYVTATSNTTGTGSGDGLYKVSVDASFPDLLHYQAPVFLGNPTLGGVQYVGTSQIETDRNGLLRMLSAQRLVAYDPTTNAWQRSNSSPVITALKAQDVNFDDAEYYRLPRQIDGWDYNLAGHIYGPIGLKVKEPGPGEACSAQPYPVAPIVATATYSVDAIPPTGSGSGKPVYSWYVTLPNSTTLAPGVAPNSVSGVGLTQFTTTFPPTVANYRILVNITYPGVNGCAANLTTLASLPVAAGNGCIINLQRTVSHSGNEPSHPGEIIVWPVPATDYFELTRPTSSGEELTSKVQLLDMSGRVLRELVWRTGTLRLPTTDIPTCVYIMRVLDTQGNQNRRVAVNHE